MATTTTALSLVNWLLRQHRLDEVSSFGSVVVSSLLDLINEAKRDVLESYAWKFDERSDVILRTLPSATTTTGTVINGSTTFSIPSFTGNWIGKSSPERVDGVVAYVAVTDDATYGSTAFRVVSASVSGTTLSGTLETAWPGTTATGGTGSLTFYGLEYALPATVRGIISVRDQERTLQLYQAMGQQEFERIIPRPMDHIGGDPAVAVVSGIRAFTHLTGDATNTGAFSSTADFSLAVYPIPGDFRILNVTYLYRHPELEATTDALSGVPMTVVDKIRWNAYYRSLISGFGNEPEVGMRGLQRLREETARIYSAAAADPFRRRPVRSLDDKGNQKFFGGRILSPFGTA